MKEKVQIHFPEIEEVRNKPPDLVVLNHELRIQIQIIRRYDIEGAADSSDNGGREVGPRDDRHLLVPLLHGLRHYRTWFLEATDQPKPIETLTLNLALA